MRKNIHPKMHTVELVLTNNDRIQIHTTFSKQNTIHLSSDMYNHPAWTGKRVTKIIRNTRAQDFQKRYSKRGL